MRLLFLFATVGLLVLLGISNEIFFNESKSDELSEENSIPQDMQQIVYTYTPEASAYLAQEKIATQDVTSWSASQKTLQNYLQLSKKSGNTRYATSGLQLYQQLSDSISNHPQVMLVHADLLKYIKNYESSLKVLNNIKNEALNKKTYFDEWKVRPEQITEQVNLRLFAHHIITGDLSSARKRCKDLRSTKKKGIPLICHAWVKGLKGSATQGIAMIERLVAVLDEKDPLKTLSTEALIDLYLYSGNSRKAIAAYNYLAKINPINLSITSHLIDFLILHNNLNQAYSILNTLPNPNSLVIRRAIVDARLNKNGAFDSQANAMIQMYELEQNPSHFYDIALWHSTKTNEQQTAWRYIQLHWDRFKSFHDKALLLTIDNALNPTTSSQSEI